MGIYGVAPVRIATKIATVSVECIRCLVHDLLRRIQRLGQPRYIWDTADVLLEVNIKRS